MYLLIGNGSFGLKSDVIKEENVYYLYWGKIIIVRN